MAAVTPVVLVVLLAVVVASPAAVVVLGADGGDGTTTHLSFFMHDIVSGSNPTAVKVIQGPGATTATAPGMSFGDTTVVDDALTETSSPTSAAVGRMQGFYMLSSQSGAALMVCANLLLTSGDHNGSTIAVLGRDDSADDVRELAVVGGTGKYRLANGYVLWKPSSVNGADSTVQLDVYLTTDGNGTIDAAAPVSPADGGSGSGSSPAAGSGAKASSGTSGRSGGGWASACVVAVVVAVVGSCWVW